MRAALTLGHGTTAASPRICPTSNVLWWCASQPGGPAKVLSICPWALAPLCSLHKSGVNLHFAAWWWYVNIRSCSPADDPGQFRHPGITELGIDLSHRWFMCNMLLCPCVRNQYVISLGCLIKIHLLVRNFMPQMICFPACATCLCRSCVPACATNMLYHWHV